MVLPLLLSASSYAIFNNSFSNGLLLFKVLILIYLLGTTIRKAKFNAFDVSIFIFIIIYMVTVLINEQPLMNGLKESAMILCYVLLIKRSSLNDSHRVIFFKVFSDAFTALLFLNAFFLLLHPTGLFGAYANGETIYGVDMVKTRYNFLGLDNAVTPIIICAIIVWSTTKELCTRQKFIYYTEYAVLLGNILLLKSSTLLVAILIIVSCSLIKRNKKKFKITMNRILILIGVLFFLVVIFNQMEIFSLLIVDLLHKDLSLTSRTNIWQMSILYFFDKPIIGHGIGNFTFLFADRNAHNMYLQIAAQMGIIGICSLITSCLISAKHAIKTTKYGTISMAGVFAFFVCCLSEVYYTYWLFLILALIHYTKNVNNSTP